MDRITAKFRLENRERLLEGRRKEYLVFGATQEDREKDVEILQEIQELKDIVKIKK